MSHPTSNPATPDDPAGPDPSEEREPIDPTRTFDAYFDKQEPAPTTPTEAIADTDYPETAFTSAADPEPDRSDLPEPIHSDPADPEPAYPATSLTKPSRSGGSYSEPSDPEPSYLEPSYPEPSYSKPSYSEPSSSEPSGTGTWPSGASYSRHDASASSETVAPAGFSAPTAVTSTVPGSTGSTESFETGPRAARMRTVVLGLVLLVIAGAVLAGQLTDITVNVSAILLALMIGGGVLLIAGARRS